MNIECAKMCRTTLRGIAVSGCGSVGRAVASDTRGSGSNLGIGKCLSIANCIKKTKITTKEIDSKLPILY